jgi:hypothetical protein
MHYTHTLSFPSLFIVLFSCPCFAARVAATSCFPCATETLRQQFAAVFNNTYLAYRRRAPMNCASANYQQHLKATVLQRQRRANCKLLIEYKTFDSTIFTFVAALECVNNLIIDYFTLNVWTATIRASFE